MKLHRFFIKNKIEDGLGEIEIDDSYLVHQIKNVLRLKKGDKVLFLDNYGHESLCSIVEVMKNKLIFSKENVKKNSRRNEVSLTIYPAVIKKDKLEYVFQKCTEIGVFKFCPLVSDRTEKLNFNIERGEMIIREAAEQSEKARLPSVEELVTLEELVTKHETKKNFLDSEFAFYLDIDSGVIDVIQVRETLKNTGNRKISIFIGPEGGWSETDKERLNFLGVKPFSLGETVLRAETASVAVSALLLLGK